MEGGGKDLGKYDGLILIPPPHPSDGALFLLLPLPSNGALFLHLPVYFQS